MAMSTFTRRQFNRTLTAAAIASGWPRDIVAARSSPGTQQTTSLGSITDVPGIKAGHYTDSRRPTGCTALLFEGKATAGRSEEHTSELQSHVNLVCRLLLEKK